VRRVRVEVTAEDIVKGEPKDHCFCPLALACKRAGIRSPVVENYSLESEDGNAALADEACDFVHDFDLGRPVKPFSFEVELSS